jgi:hypothetical protein
MKWTERDEAESSAAFLSAYSNITTRFIDRLKTPQKDHR